MLEIKNLNKTFFEDNTTFEILKDINISAKKGEFVCILGPSGCGKTILLYIIAGFLEKTSGQVIVDGKIVKDPHPDRMMVFQDYVLFPWKTVLQNVLFAFENNKETSKKEEIANKYLDIVGLSNFKDWYIHKLSGGMQQRVAIARALAVDPKVLLMDEPLSALDSQYRKFLRKKVEQIWNKTKKTIIFVTHSISEAIYLADKIYLMSPRPATIKKVYDLKEFKRPRDTSSKEFVKLKKEIEKEMSLDFKKMLNNFENKSIDIEKKMLDVKL